MAAHSLFSEIHGFIEELFVDEHPSILGSTPYPDSLVDEILVEPISQNLTFPTDNGVGHVLGATSVPSVFGEVKMDGLFSDPGVNRGEILSPGVESSSSLPGDGNDSSEAVLKYINQILKEEDMEKDMEEIPWFFSDQDALQNTEKSLYNAKDRVSCVNGTSVGSSNFVDPNYDLGLLNASYSGGKTIPRSMEVAPSLLSCAIRSGDSSSPSNVTKLSVTDIFSDRNSVETVQERVGGSQQVPP